MNKYQESIDNKGNQDAEIDMLVAMGFDVVQARRALEANSGDVDEALDDLCSGKYFPAPCPPMRHPKDEAPTSSYQQQDDIAKRKAAAGSSVRGDRARMFSGKSPRAASNDSLGVAPLTPPNRDANSGKSPRAASNEILGVAPLTPPNRDASTIVSSDGSESNDVKHATPSLTASNRASTTRGSESETSHRVGAIAVSGGGRRATDIEAGDYDNAYICDDTELVTARAIHPTPSHEPALTPSPEILIAELMPPESNADASKEKEEERPLWTRRCILLIALLALLVGGAVAGTLLALNKDGTAGEVAPFATTTQEPLPTTTQESLPATTQESPPTTTQEPPPTTTQDIKLYLETIRPNSNVGDRFADFVVVSRDGSTIAAGAEVGNYVKVYRHSGSSWNQVGQTLHGSGQFGKGVDLNEDGNMMIVGAWNNDDKAKGAGHAKVFRLEGGEWKQVGGTLLGRAGDDRYGWYVSMSDDGRTVAASAVLGDAGGKEQAGYVRVFTLDANDEWVQLGNDLEGENKFEQNGRAMAMSANGRRLAVATTRWNQETGIVRVFDWMEGSWQQVGKDLIGSLGGDWFGSGVALNAEGDIVAVGADGVKTPAGNKAGLVRVFHLEGHNWQQYGQDILGEQSQGRLGLHQVALSDDGCRLVAGAKGVDNYTGKGYVFTYKDNEWKKVAEVSGDVQSDELGESVSISGDGRWVAFGAREYNTSRPGYIRVYDANHAPPC